MAEQDILNAFDDCIDRINIGQSINDCLRGYPQQAATLRPMLEAGKQVQRLRVPTTEVVQAQARTRFRFEESLRVMQPRRRSSYPIYRFASLAATVLIIIMVISGSATIVAQSSLPGDQLYGLKLLSEQIRESVSGDPSLSAQFNQRRIDETQRLLSANRAADITFQGTITAVTGAIWTIDGLPVHVSAATIGAELAHTGDLVEVEGYTTLQGELSATRIRPLITTKQPIPTIVPTTVPVTTRPTPSATPTAEPTQTPTPTETILPTKPADIVVTPSATLCVSTPPTGWEVYVVQTGDTLSHLASNRGISLDLLMSVNCVVNPGLIVVGQTLYLPSGASISPTLSNSGNGSQGGQPNATATDDHGGQNSGGDNSGSGSSNSGSNSSGDNHGGDSSGGHGSDG